MNVHTNPSRKPFALLLIVALLAPAAWEGTTAFADEDKPETIADYMGIINDQHKQLRRTARRKNFDDASIAQTAEMIKAAKVCRDMVPPMAERFSGAEKEKFIEGYKKSMDDMIAVFVDLEKALKAKENDKAAQIIEESLAAIKKEGHDKYVEE